jgi:hypothetical protein
MRFRTKNFSLLITSFGRVCIRAWKVQAYFDPVPNGYTDFGDTAIYWNGRLILYLLS